MDRIGRAGERLHAIGAEEISIFSFHRLAFYLLSTLGAPADIKIAVAITAIIVAAILPGIVLMHRFAAVVAIGIIGVKAGFTKRRVSGRTNIILVYDSPASVAAIVMLAARFAHFIIIAIAAPIAPSFFGPLIAIGALEPIALIQARVMNVFPHAPALIQRGMILIGEDPITALNTRVKIHRVKARGANIQRLSFQINGVSAFPIGRPIGITARRIQVIGNLQEDIDGQLHKRLFRGGATKRASARGARRLRVS
jgi:hypothetical protein